MKLASQCDRVLAVLEDGLPHTITEIHERAGTMRLNSRVAELRKRGLVIECTRKDRVYSYQLRSLSSPEGIERRLGPADGPSGELSEDGRPSGRGTSPPSLDPSGGQAAGSPEPLSLSPDDSDEQLKLEGIAA